MRPSPTPIGAKLEPFFIPSYNVWDLTGRSKFVLGRVGVFAGINNLFNQDFYAEIRDEAVSAYLRNYYGGFSLKF